MEEDNDEPRRSARLQKPRRSARLNNVSWIDDDLDELKYYTYSDDRVYQHEDKTHIVPIEKVENDNVDKIDKSINSTTLHSPNYFSDFHANASSKKPHNASRIVGNIILGLIYHSFPACIHNAVINQVGNTSELIGGIPHSHILETDINIIDDDTNMRHPDLLTHSNLTMKKELQFMDIVNDEEEKDTSFVPRKIIDHRISR